MNRHQVEKSDNPARSARRQQLVDAAINCIYEFGLEKTTVSRVTKAAGLSAGTINFHFASKDQLMRGVLESVRDEFIESLPVNGDSSDPVKTLTAIVDMHFDESISSPRKVATWHAFSSASSHRKEYVAICGEFDQMLQDLVVEQFAALREAADKPHYAASALGRALIGLLDDLWQERLYAPDTVDTKAARQCAMQYLSSLFPEQFGTSLNATEGATPAETSDLLPAWTYSNESFLELEIDQLFKTHWMLAGHVSQLASPKDYITFDGFGERAFIVRGDDGELRAFHNVCRHRGARLLEGDGSCRLALTCPFHGWSYDLRGNLLNVPAKETFGDLDMASNNLIPVEMEVWMGFVFIRFRQDGAQGSRSMGELMAPVEDLIAPYRTEEMQLLKGSTYRELRPYNWKVIHDIDNEGYHVPVGHPSLQQLYGGNYTDTTVAGISVSRGYLNDRAGKFWSVRNYKSLLPDYDHLPEDNRRLWLYIGIAPNMVIGLYPESVEYYMTIPQSVNQTWYTGARFGLEDDSRETRAVRFLNKRINEETEAEDESFVRWLQDGMRSSAFPEQKLSSLEQGVRTFHKSIQSMLPVANLAEAPPPERIRAINAGFQNTGQGTTGQD